MSPSGVRTASRGAAATSFDPADVLTASHAGMLVKPYIHPLGPCNDSLLPA